MEKQLKDLKLDGNEVSRRHCAFCLIEVKGRNIKLCGGCKKRAYCTKKCQVADWSLKQSGAQGHKNWCKLDCGEEDIDWEVLPVEGKGLGLIAKRLIPEKSRIMVDAMRYKDHPAVQDLMPTGGTIHEKLNLNALRGTGSHEDVLFLRIARANHNCDHNANHYFDETFKVKILFSEREIKQGEEICIAYQAFNDTGIQEAIKYARLALEVKWRIVCPSDCICRDLEHNKLVQRARELDGIIFHSTGNPGRAMLAVQTLINMQSQMRSSYIYKWRTLYDGYQVANMSSQFRDLAEGFIRRVYGIASAILSPESPQCLNFRRQLDQCEEMNMRTYHAINDQEKELMVDDK